MTTPSTTELVDQFLEKFVREELEKATVQKAGRDWS